MEQAKCELCGEPMPKGEEMFKYHGYSCNCPKPPLPKKPSDPQTVVADMVRGWLSDQRRDRPLAFKSYSSVDEDQTIDALAAKIVEALASRKNEEPSPETKTMFEVAASWLSKRQVENDFRADADYIEEDLPMHPMNYAVCPADGGEDIQPVGDDEYGDWKCNCCGATFRRDW
jgi:hypothetical protein